MTQSSHGNTYQNPETLSNAHVLDIRNCYMNSNTAMPFQIFRNTLVSAISALIRISIVTDSRLSLARIYLMLILQLIAP